MGVQIIKRKAGEKPEITNIGRGKIQISYNSDGHIIVRYINSQNDDTLIVLDVMTSNALIRFIKDALQDDARPLF
ncbi:hypothetical protein DXT63_08570 [Thermoanaerobacteraceae bacterium SP2]|nr:hypothetical protein DXT63_08570 [Thermoanaerobacteraceae bacterium SP2]